MPTKKFIHVSLAVLSVVFTHCNNASTSSSASSTASSATGVDTVCPNIGLPAPANAAGLALADPQSGQTAFVNQAIKIVQQNIAPGVEIDTDENSLNYTSTSEHISFGFSISGKSLPQVWAKVSFANNKFLLKSHIPPQLAANNTDTSTNTFVESAASLSWQDSDSDLNALVNFVLQSSSSTETSTSINTMVSSNQVIYIDDSGTMQPAWESIFKIGRYPYKALSKGNTIYKMHALYFDAVDGQSQIYFKNPDLSLTLKTFSLSDLSDGKSLCSPKFQLQAPSGVPIAYSATEQFIFDPSDQRFPQTSVFTNVNVHGDWLMSQPGLGGIWPGPRLILSIFYYQAGNSSSNTALYAPIGLESATNPVIELGPGDGVQLKNLQIDADAVSHELGHHFIYQTLQDVSSFESKSVHEGMADYFVMARNNSPCLGPLICPQGGTVCISTSCLRSSDNTMRFDDNTLLTLSPHQYGQLVSGLLWDLGKSLGSQSSSANIALKAISFFDKAAGFVDVVQSLMEADQAMNAGKNACTIQQVADNRGLTTQLTSANIDCHTYQK
jgi:hypothetical protein